MMEWFAIVVLFVTYGTADARVLPGAAMSSDSCMVTWLQLPPGTRNVQDARRAERVLLLPAVPVDESNVNVIDPLLMSVVLGGDAHAEEFRACMSRESAQCRQNAPCRNGGQCLYSSTSLQAGYRCSCRAGFTGHLCETSPCRCLNGGVCSHNGTRVTCHCPPLFSGAQCEKRWLGEDEYTELKETVQELAQGLKTIEAAAEKSRAEDRSNIQNFLQSLERRMSSTLTTKLSASEDRSAKRRADFEAKMTDSERRMGGMLAKVEAIARQTSTITPPAPVTTLQQIRSEATAPPPSLEFGCQRGQGNSGVFTGRTSSSNFRAFCDQRTNGGGWIVIQRRQDGSVDFYRTWDEYKLGFGNADGEYWLGLETIHQLTSQPGKTFELRVDVTFTETGEKKFVLYSSFKVGPESDNYRLRLSGFSSPDLPDRLSWNSGQQFSTKDRDNDPHGMHCSLFRQAGWWFHSCTFVNLNGRYGLIPGNHKGAVWYSKPLSSIQMKIRQVE